MGKATPQDIIDAKLLLIGLKAAEDVSAALRAWGGRLTGKTAYVPPGGSNPDFLNVPDKTLYITESDRQATRKLFAMIAENAKLLRQLLSEYGCHEHMRPHLTGMLDLANGSPEGKDMGGWWSRANSYAGSHLWAGDHLSVPGELEKWAAKLRTEAVNHPGPAQSLGRPGGSGDTDHESHPEPKRNRGKEPMTPERLAKCQEHYQEWLIFYQQWTAAGTKGRARLAFANSKSMTQANSDAMIRSGKPKKKPKRPRGKSHG